MASNDYIIFIKQFRIERLKCEALEDEFYSLAGKVPLSKEENQRLDHILDDLLPSAEKLAQEALDKFVAARKAKAQS